jgi:hypothetical protein
MGQFFDARTPADRKLLADYDSAVSAFRNEVSDAMEEVADAHPSIAMPMRAAAEAVRSRPLPSEANSDAEAMKRLTMSSLTVETVFSKLKNHAGSQEALDAAMAVTVRMREISKETIGKPEFRPLTDAVLKAVAGMKAEVTKEMDQQVFDLYVAGVKGAPPKAKPAAPAAPKP